MATEQLVNNARTTVAAGGYTPGSGVLNVTSTAAPFPANPNFRVTLSAADGTVSSVLKVTAINSSTQWAVTAEGSDVAASAGDYVDATLTAGSLAQLFTEFSASGPYASRPTSGARAGSYYRCTDSPYEFLWNGSSWDAYAFGRPAYIPNSTGWVWKAQGSNLTRSETRGIWEFAVANAGSTPDSSVFWHATPSTPYKVHAIFQLFCTGGNAGQNTPQNTYGGIFLGRNSDGFGTMWLSRGSGDLMCYTVTAGSNNYSTITDPGVSVNSAAVNGSINGGLLMLAIEDDGTTKTYGIHDGYGNILQLFTRTHTQDITPDRIGVYLTSGANLPARLNLISWREF